MTRPELAVEAGPEWRELARRAQRGPFAARAGELVQGSMEKIADTYRRSIAKGVARHRRGKLRDPKVIVRGRGADARIRVATGAGTNLLVAGVRPHRIRAYGRPMPIQGAGVVGFAQAVDHPGYRGDPFVARGIDAAAGDVRGLERDLLDDLRRLLTGASGR